MTLLVIEDERYVEPDELESMVTDAIDRLPVEVCDADTRSFAFKQFNTDGEFVASGSAEVRASLCQREATVCGVEFDVIGGDPDTAAGYEPSKVHLRVVEEILPD